MGNVLMKFTYHIYQSSDLIAATLESDEPLPHLEVGHELILNTEKAHEGAGSLWVIEHIRVVASHLGGQFVRYDVHLAVRPTQGSPLLP
jgi:hypothetical protein